MKRLKYILPVIICFFAVSLVFPRDNTSTDTNINELNKGLLYLNSNNVNKAIEYFNGLINSGESDSMLYFYLGDACQKKGDLKNAIKNYNQAIHLDANNISAYYNLGLVEIMEGHSNKAGQDFESVIKIQPDSILAEMAGEQIQSINNTLNTAKILKKWKSEEIALLAEETKVKTTTKVQQKGVKPGMPGMPPGMPGMPSMPGVKTLTTQPQKTIEQTIEDMEYGILSVRESASQSLLYYSQADIQKNLQSLIKLVDSERNPEIIKNLLFAIGIAGTPDAGKFLLRFLNRQYENFSLKLVALGALGNITNNPDLAEKLKDILKSLVEKWENKIDEANSAIDDANNTILSLEEDKSAIVTDIHNLRKTINTERKKLGIGSMRMPGMPPGMPGTQGFASSQRTALTADERKTLNKDLKNNQASLKEKQKKIQRIAMKEHRLQEKIAKEKVILSFSFAKLQSTAPVMPQLQMGQGMPPGMPGRMGMMAQTSVNVRASFKNQAIHEQSFAFALIETLGKLGNTDCLNAIQNAWSIFGNKSFKIHYYLAEAQLGDYDHIGTLLRRLKENYPSGTTQLADEISLREGIVTILGQYLVQNKNKEFQGLLEYISQSDPNKEVRNAAQQAFLKLK
ncbi:MAG: tetratricopeptide repeat protein [Candidatus Omnitrophica bacterium]|nr:tetratricopeptide repeat protein [Candidatus Omnitrophota bacterium]